MTMVRLDRLPATATTSAGSASAKYQQRVSEKDGEWEAMFGRLQVFKKVKGHCQADQDADEPELGRWVMTQRRQFQDLSHAKSSAMTQERAKKLHELGLDFASSAAVIVSPTQETRDEAPPAVSDASPCTSPTRDNGFINRKTKAPATPSVPDDHPETRRPPKKRKKSLEVVAQKKTDGESVAETEERDACAGGSERGDSERQEVSPLVEKEVIKGRGDSAWETLMNVAALVPPLPVAVPTAGTKSATSSPTPSAKSTPSKKAAKSKYGDLDALPNAGGSYSSKYRAANNDVVPNQQRWEDMFVRLQTYKRIYGHCRVPNRYSEDPSLGSWVATQRRYYKNKNLPMPEDRVRRLTDLGFEWTTKDPRKVPWETRFEDLQAFKEKFGHADVPHEWEECPQLGFWTANMRQQYRYKQLGKKSSLTDDRIELLNSIGFVWKMQGGRRKKSDPVARPNQNGSPGYESSTSVSESYTGETPIKSKPLVLDPMSPAVGTVTSSYIPPPPVTMIKEECPSRSPPFAVPYVQPTSI